MLLARLQREVVLGGFRDILRYLMTDAIMLSVVFEGMMGHLKANETQISHTYSIHVASLSCFWEGALCA